MAWYWWFLFFYLEVAFIVFLAYERRVHLNHDLFEGESRLPKELFHPRVKRQARIVLESLGWLFLVARDGIRELWRDLV